MEQKIFLIIGGSSGISKVIAEKLHEQGHRLIIAARDTSAWADTEGIQIIQQDVVQEPLQTEMFPDVLNGFVYAPGTINLKPFRSLKKEDFLQDLEVNLIGAVENLRPAYKALRKSKDASVLLFSTVAVQQGMPFHASIAAAKGAVEGLVRSLAAEWAPDIRVNAIAPSLTDTPLAEALLSTEARIESSRERHPLKQIGSAEDLGNFAATILTQARWMTGQVIGYDGGLSRLRV